MTAAVDYARSPSYRRVVARAESADLVHWVRARPVLELPQEGDPPGLSTYGMSVFPYEGKYLGLLRVFHNERDIDLQLAYSDDDLTWHRAPGRMPFIGLLMARTSYSWRSAIRTAQFNPRTIPPSTR